MCGAFPHDKCDVLFLVTFCFFLKRVGLWNWDSALTTLEECCDFPPVSEFLTEQGSPDFQWNQEFSLWTGHTNTPILVNKLVFIVENRVEVP